MAWGALIGGGISLLGGLFGGSSQRSAAAAQNAAAKKAAERQFARASQEWEIDFAQKSAQWQWDKARIQQLRFNEKQTAADYKTYQARLIDAANNNLRINKGALRDKYVVEERLRGTQVGMEYAATTNRLGAESSEVLRQYLSQINQAALQGDTLTSRVTGESQELLGSLALDEERDQLGWQINQLAAMAKGAEAKGASIVRQGGGATAQRLAMDAGNQLGRMYGELVMKSQDRDLKVALMNRTMKDTVSKEMGQLALQMQDGADKMRYTTSKYSTDYDITKQQMEKLAIPSFALANRQYQRELDALQLQTQQVYDQGSQPYRKQKYMMPIEPIKGLKPEMISPTQVSAPSWGSIIGNSILSGAQSAMQFTTQKPGGGLAFY
jgi:hypothetical protein